MTAKQKAAREKFKAVVKEASKLRKKNPKLTQAQAIKQAWAIDYSTKRKSTKKKIADVGRVKKSAPKKKTATKKAVSTHKDTKSHNVNIRVMSGTDKFHGKILDELNHLLNKISNLEIERDRIKSGIKFKHYSKDQILRARNMVKHYNEWIKELKSNIRTIKKGIK